MQLQTPASFASSIQELIIALQRTGDPHDLQNLRSHLDKLSLIDPSPESPAPSWMELEECMTSLLTVVEGLQAFAKVRFWHYLYWLDPYPLNACLLLKGLTFLNKFAA